MRHKILIADDSLTIQKVIKITLANEPFDLEVCSSASELTAKVQSFNPNIVLLDFNLSEDKTGYDLCTKIKELDSATKVFMLFGTFDNIDEDKISDSGCDNKIVKPFDGTKFINICRTLASQIVVPDGSQDAEEDYDFGITKVQPPKSTFEMDQDVEIDEDSDWVMDAPIPEEKEEEILDIPAPITLNKSMLELEAEDWGMNVPGVIPSDSEKFSAHTTYPANEDLEYPDVITDTHNLAEIDFDAPREGTNTDEELKRIQEQIKDEVETEDIWAFDELEEGDIDIPMVDTYKIEEDEGQEDEYDFNDHHTKDDFDLDFTAKPQGDLVASLDSIFHDPEFEAKIKKQLQPIVEEYVRQYSKSMIEKVAWEVIPDLAENLIKKEIERISDSIINP